MSNVTGCRACYGRWCVSCRRRVKVFCHCTHGKLASGPVSNPAEPCITIQDSE